MFDNNLVAIPCQVRPGAFSGERVFSVELADGARYEGVAPRQFLWNAAGQLVASDEPGAKEGADGFLAGHLIRRDDRIAVVEVPDGEHLAVKATAVRPRPSLIAPPRRPQPEVPPHVPV